MVAVSYLSKSDLHKGLNSTNLDPTAQQKIIDQLVQDGLYHSGDNSLKIWVESDIYDGTQEKPLFGSQSVGTQPFSNIQLLEVEKKDVTVQTDAALKVIVDDGGDAGTHNLTVTGGAFDEFIVLGNRDTKVTLTDHGNDTVIGGSGHDTIIANDGDDSLVAGTGDTKLVGGSGHDTLVGGSGHDTLIGGSGANYLYGGSGDSTLTAGTGHGSWLQAGTGPTLMTDMSSGGYDTLVAGSGNDTIIGQQGDFFTTDASLGASGHDLYKIYDGNDDPGHRDSVINLGSGDDTVKFFTTAGNDTINSGGGVDTIDFTNSSHHSFAGATITEGSGAQSGDWTINFADGQHVQLNAHGQSQDNDAFVLKFDGVTIHLQGGS